jgi:DNA helicase II / ATP-dependent DNA helicase PcrA
MLFTSTKNHEIKRIKRGTDQQEIFWEGLINGNKNIMVEARAGCGKSSSCREGMHRLIDKDPSTAITYVVFNTANAREFEKQSPDNVTVGTCHSLGYKLITAGIGFRKVSEDKTFQIMKANDKFGVYTYAYKRRIKDLISHAKNQFLDIELDTKTLAIQIGCLADYFGMELEDRRAETLWAATFLKESAVRTDLIDFDDMLWLPAVHKLRSSSPCDVFFVDEVQDFNPVQQELLRLFCPDGRIVAVGDRYQSIYGFRGADCESVPNLISQLENDGGLDVYPLTMTFRCPKKHVELARQYVKDFEAHESNSNGILRTNLEKSDIYNEAVPGDLVLCSKNNPLIEMCLKFVSLGKKAIVKGKDIGKQLISILHESKVFGKKPATTIQEASFLIESYLQKNLEKLQKKEGSEALQESLEDRVISLQTVIATCESIGQIEPAIKSLFSDSEPENTVTFSTVHRAKGAEAERVWIYDSPLRKPKTEWEEQQRRNLNYVALTRSKNAMMLVSKEEN